MYQHGGDIYGTPVELDFSINVNPLGIPDEVVEAACNGVRVSGKYPDYACRALRDALAEAEGYEKEHLIFGNGAAELIFLVCQAVRPKRALVLAPTFAEYEEALQAVDCKVEYVHLRKEEGFAVTEEILRVLETGYDLFFLCNPNNPTGEIVDKELVEKIVSACKAQGTWLVVDECFQEFLEEEEQHSLIPKLSSYDRLCVVKAFTKIYCMAGLRLGYLLTANEGLRTKMERLSQPWRVSIPAQYAGIAAIQATDYLERTKQVIRAERAYVKEGLQAEGIRCFASKANYIFFQEEEGLKEALLEKGILIRSCSNYVGLDGTYYRVGLRRHEENTRLLEAIHQVKKEREEHHG